LNRKLLIGGLIVLAGILLVAVNLLDTVVEYGDFAKARRSRKNIQVKGEWVREKESFYETDGKRFIFYLKDDSGETEKVILNGAKPDNFEIANSVVVKGKYMGEYFLASDVLTKCPSKYEGKKGTMK
jgi:cytochrome c-type biogenesis protein CcmE